MKDGQVDYCFSMLHVCKRFYDTKRPKNKGKQQN